MELLSIPAITAITQLFKIKSKKLTPFISIIIGIVIAVAFSIKSGEVDYFQAVIDGLMMGLGASGLYSGGKTVIKKQ